MAPCGAPGAREHALAAARLRARTRSGTGWAGTTGGGRGRERPDARERLIAELREHALVIGEVTLTSGAKAQYLVDAKRAILLPAGFAALGELVADVAARRRAPPPSAG